MPLFAYYPIEPVTEFDERRDAWAGKHILSSAIFSAIGSQFASISDPCLSVSAVDRWYEHS